MFFLVVITNYVQYQTAHYYNVANGFNYHKYSTYSPYVTKVYAINTPNYYVSSVTFTENKFYFAG